MTLNDLLRGRARRTPDRPAYLFLTDGETEADRLTWGELDRRARSVAGELCRRCAPGDRALLLYPPGLDFIAAFFGCLYAGVVAVPAYPPRPRRDQPRLRAIVLDARPRVGLTTSSLLAGIGEVLAREPALAALDWLAPDGKDLGNDAGEDGPDGIGRPVLPEAPAFLQYTSGSTALPKGVVVSHANLLHNERTIHAAFGLDESSVVVGWLPLYHDMGLIGTALQPLYCGGRCVLMSPAAFLQRPRRWLEAISRYRGTTSGGPNFAYELCVRKIGPAEREGLDLASWTVAFNGAEPVRADTLDRFAAAFAPSGFARRAFYPCYGLAEATLFVSGGRPGEGARTATVSAAALARHEVAAGEGEGALRLVSSGRPAAEQRLLIVDPESRAECPPGRVGEIWISGPSVARAYWGRPEVSASELGASLADGSGSFLRTGDLGFLQAGELYVTGRRKDLIILRGRNHYPQDLELTAERAHPALVPGAGAAFPVDVAGEERLVLVFEADRHALAALAVDEVAAAVRQALAAEHEVRLSELVLLRQGSLPRTSSGKVQRHACRDLYLSGGLLVVGRAGDDLAGDAENAERSEDAGSTEEQPPSVESFLRAALARVARVDPARIDRGQAMSSYGLDSLAAVELHNAVEAELGAAPSVAELLEGITLAEAARELAARPAAVALPGAEEPAGAPAGRTGEHPLSLGQQALWALYGLEPASAAYNIAGAARLSGVAPAVLGRAFQSLLDRHPSLRTTYANGPRGPVQRTGAPGAGLRREDAAGWSAEELRRRVHEAAFQPFDLEAGPVVRAVLFDRGAADPVLVLAVHHIVADFWSLAVLVRELGELCAADGRTERSVPPASPPPTVEIARRESRKRAAGHYDGMLAAARSQLAGAPPLDLGDRPRPKFQTYGGSLRSRHLGPELAGGLRALARRHGATLFMVLLAGFEALLARSGGPEDFIVGTPTSGRSSRELEELVGYLVNPVALRADLSGDPDATALLARARRSALDAFARQDLPFPLLAEGLAAERDPSRPPVFQAMLTLQRAPGSGVAPLAAFALGEEGARLQAGNLVLESVALEPPSAQLDLTLFAGEVERDLVTALQLNRDLFDATTAERMLGHLAGLLAAMASPEAGRLSELAMLSPAESHQLLVEWNATAAAAPAACLHELIEAQALRSPAAPAVTCGEEVLTYRELQDRAARLARHLEDLGAGPEVLVGVCLERSTDLIVALLATLEAGGAFVPIDPSYPAERLAFMLEDSRAALVLTQERLAASLPAGGRPVLVDAEAGWRRGAGATARGRRISPDHLAYVLYTSGSTGRPKGAMNSHRAIVNRLCWMQKAFPLTAADRVLQKTPASFDVSVWELFWPLMTGACLVMARPGGHLDPPYLRDEIAARGVTTVHFVPSLLQIFLDQPGLAACACLRRVVVSGEALSRDLAARFEAGLGNLGVELHNLYGPTEAAVDVTWWPCPATEDARPVPIGRPIDNTRVSVLDRSLRPVPVGAAGELCIGGVQVARGYLRRPGLTAERFIPDPSAGFFAPAGGRLYRTGDLVRHRPGGELEFLGRIDHQVKVRGVRIELGEIEAALAAHAGVREAVVLARGEAAKARLAAYVVPAGAAPMGAELRAHLAARLPDAMIPGAWVFLPALPLTPNGKVDRKALPEPDREAAATAFVAPRSAAEETLAAIWSEVLERDRIGVHDNFFALGGDSILGIQVLSRAAQSGLLLTPRQIFRHPTVAELAVVAGQAAGETGEAPVPEPEDGGLAAAGLSQRDFKKLMKKLGGAGPGAVR